MAKRGRPTKTESILRGMKSKPEVRTPIASEMYIPNLSGDHSKGKVRTTPSNDLDLVNKKYVDDNIGGVDWEADQSPKVIHANNYVDNDTTYSSSDFTHDDLIAGTIADHDTSATGAELNTLTDNSMADTLHRHSELSAGDGTPDATVSVDNDGIVDMAHQSGCQVYLSNPQTISNATMTKVEFNAEDFDNQGEFDSTTNYEFTVKKAGYYQVNARAYWIPNTAAGRYITNVYVNGVQAASSEYSGTPDVYMASQVSEVLHLTANDNVDFRVYQNSGSNKNLFSGKSYTVMSIIKVA